MSPGAIRWRIHGLQSIPHVSVKCVVSTRLLRCVPEVAVAGESISHIFISNCNGLLGMDNFRGLAFLINVDIEFKISPWQYV